MRQLYCFFGAPCSGKGTLVQAIKGMWGSKFEIGVVTCGDMVRSILTEETKAAMADGSLYPLEDRIRGMISHAVRKSLANGAYVVLLDGAPRFADQLLWLDSEFFDLDPVYVHVTVSDRSILTQRAAARARDDFDTDQSKFMARLRKQAELVEDAEREIFRRGLGYCTVLNDNTTVALAEFNEKAPKPDFNAIRRKHG